MFIIYLLYSILLCVVVPLVLALTPEAKLKSFITTMLLYILYNIYQNNVYLFNTRRVIENKPRCMASNDLTFSFIVYIK